ncbi:cytochrome P450 [Mycobacterium sp.]|uniref:cytochrome P450 n=1 Tax=Mycobacterium sp. TaxID=1785 RepID=UPI002C7839D6|nr:cytochrome P450 [Mycobacterium sp.]HTQ20065.1 cytochrome P450 [Mycobacterium sp.]
MTATTHTRHIFDVDWPTFAYQDAADPDTAHRIIRQAQQQAPIALGPYGPEVLSYDLVRAVLRDSRFELPRGMGLVVQGITSGPVSDKVCQTIMCVDTAQHQRLRRLVSRAFTPRAAERMRTACAAVITELLDRHSAAGHCDMVRDIARPYPVPIICALLGAPAGDWELFSGWADDISKAFGDNVAASESAILRAWGQLDTYVEDLIARRRHAPGDDLISELVRIEDDGDRLSHDELVNLVAILLNAGTETTRNQLAAAVQVLADHPDQWALLAENPGLAPKAVEEVMRHFPITFAGLRVATTDVELGLTLVPAGAYVLPNTAAANRDPAVYVDPDRLDIAREGPAPMLTFGGGAHYCLGAHLARIELAEALKVITRRMPNARRTGPVPWKPIAGISGPASLPIAFDAGR